jgi:hypothetical protein
MGLLVKNKSVVFVKKETTTGVYAAPASASDALEVLSSGAELALKRDIIDRQVLTSTIENVASRVGMKNVSGNLPTEYKAGSVAGAEPRESILFESLLGGKRSSVTVTTKATGNTSTSLAINDADISKFAIGDCVLVKVANKYEVRPISAVVTTTGSATITFPFALTNGAPSGATAIEAFSTFYHDSNAYPSFSTSYYVAGAIKEVGLGCKSISGSLESWETGKIPSWKFAISGLDMTQAVSTPTYTPDFTADAKAPTMFLAQAWINGVAVDYNKLGLTLTNEKSDVLSAAASSGKIDTKKVKFTVEGTIDPYKSDSDVNQFTAYNNNSDISLFAYAFYDDGSVAGQFKNVVAIYIPRAKVTELTQADKNGVVTEEIKFRAYRGAGNDSVFLGFI